MKKGRDENLICTNRNCSRSALTIKNFKCKSSVVPSFRFAVFAKRILPFRKCACELRKFSLYARAFSQTAKCVQWIIKTANCDSRFMRMNKETNLLQRMRIFWTRTITEFLRSMLSALISTHRKVFCFASWSKPWELKLLVAGSIRNTKLFVTWI